MSEPTRNSDDEAALNAIRLVAPSASVPSNTKSTGNSDDDAASAAISFLSEKSKPKKLTKQDLLSPMESMPWLGQSVDQPKSTGGLEELGAGTGRGMYMAGLGVGQTLGLASKEDVKEARKSSEGLMDTRMGRLGNLIGGGAAYAPLTFIPGANTALGSALIGGGAGAIAPSESNEELGKNILGGAIGGPLFNKIGSAAGAGLSQVAPSLREGAAGSLNNWASGSQSMGAASSVGADISQASPELKHSYAQAVAEGKTPKQDVIARHVEADSLPVPIRLTEGQATQDPDTISREMNHRGATGLSQFHNQQDAALTANIQHLRESVGPDVFTTNPTEHGDTLIQAYKDRDAPIVADIDAKYQALNDAAGGEFPVDGQTFAVNARAALKKSLKSGFVPAGIESDLKAFESGEPMSFEQFEAMRSNLASEMRDNPTGNARTAAKIIRQQLEELPLKGGAAELKPLADSARSAAKERFSALEADPAYKAAVEGTVPPDKFIPKFVTGGDRDNIAIMRQHLDGNDRALQTMGVAAVDDLRAAAGVDAQGNGAFNQARFNKRLQIQSAKLPHLIPGEQRQQLETLGNVSRYIKAQPVGNVVNNSGTLSGAIAEGAVNLATNVADIKTGGMASVARKGWSLLNKGKELKETTKPLAGGFKESQ